MEQKPLIVLEACPKQESSTNRKRSSTLPPSLFPISQAKASNLVSKVEATYSKPSNLKPEFVMPKSVCLDNDFPTVHTCQDTEGDLPTKEDLLKLEDDEEEAKLLAEPSEASTEDSPTKKPEAIDGEERVSLPRRVVCYLDDIYQYLRTTEPALQVKQDHLSSQTEVNERMRAILVDWLVEIQVTFRLKTETLFLAVSLIDRYLEKKTVSRANFQLVGVAALLIANKYEEVLPAELGDFAQITEKMYTIEQILEYEGEILYTLAFKLTIASPLCFIERYSQILNCSKKELYFARYVLETGLLDSRLLSHQPSLQAASVLYISKLREENWNGEEAFCKELGYNLDSIETCAEDMMQALQKYHQSKSLRVIREKYARSCYQGVSVFDLEKLVKTLQSNFTKKKK